MLSPPRTFVALALLGLAACRPAAPPPDNQTEPPRDPAVEKTPLVLPQPERPLDREGVLLAAIRARSAAAAGKDDTEAQAQLDGKRFEFRIPLGCSIAAAGTEGAAATYDPERRRVELSVGVDAGLGDPVIAAAAAGRFEAAEGFWIADPWLLTPHCAGTGPAPAAPAPAPASGATAEAPPALRAGGVALVQFFTPEEPRTERRDGRAYEASETLAEGSGPPAPGTWELVLSGRLHALGNGRVIACQRSEAGRPPACVVSVRFDRVAIQNRARGERLAEWGGG